jgi:hypothetical protein
MQVRRLFRSLNLVEIVAAVWLIRSGRADGEAPASGGASPYPSLGQYAGAQKRQTLGITHQGWNLKNQESKHLLFTITALILARLSTASL